MPPSLQWLTLVAVGGYRAVRRPHRRLRARPRPKSRSWTPSDWDVDGKYTELIDARAPGRPRGNDVRVYRIVKSGTRVEYWLLTTTADGEGPGSGSWRSRVES